MGINMRLPPILKILGYIVNNENFWPLNMVLMTTRKYTFWCSRKGHKLNVFSSSRKYTGVSYAVFLSTVFTESYQGKILVMPMKIVCCVAMLSFIHDPKIEIFQSVQVAKP